MSVLQTAGIGFTIVGDGVSTEQLVDVQKWIETPISAGSPFNSYPVNGMVVVTQPTYNYTTGLPNNPIAHFVSGTAEVYGTVVRIIWSVAPPVADASTSVSNGGLVLGY